MLHQDELASFHASLVGPRYVGGVQEVACTEKVEDRILNIDLLAGLSVEPGLAHVVGAEEAEEGEDRQLDHR